MFSLYFFLSLCFSSYLFTSSLVYFLTYPSTSSSIDPFRFQAGGRRRWPNLALVFWFIICCSIFVMDACLLLLCLFQFFSTKPRYWLGKTFSKWRILCRVGRKTLTQSINSISCGYQVLLLWVNLIKWVSNIRLPVRTSVRPSVHPSVRPQTVSSISMKFGMQVEVNEWCMTVCSMTRSKVKVTNLWKSEIRSFSKSISSPIYNGGWQMTTDS